MKAAVRQTRQARAHRRGSATLDYALVLGAMMPMAGLALYYSSKMVKLVYQLTCAWVSWPFM